jgi:hypothetical protein
MMTALLSVGAWAQSLQTVTLFEGTQATTSASHLSIDKENFKGARVGSQLNIYYTITAGNNVCYFGNGWKSTWSNADGTSVSVLLDNDVISSVYGLDIHPQNEGVTMTVTKVTLSYNGVNLLSSESGISPHIWGGAQQLKKGLFAHATEGDVLSVNVSAISQSWKKMFLTSGQGNPEDMNDAVNVYNSTPSETEIALSASSFTDIVVGSYIHFTTTKGGIEAKSSGTTLASNLYWNEISFYVTAENISTIQTNGITVTVTETSDNTLTVTKKNPKNTCPTEYWRTEDLTVGEKVNIPLTSALLGYAREGEGDGNLYLSGNDYSTTSVDLIYQPSAVNIGSAGYATFGYPFAVDLSGLGEGQDAYTVTVNGDEAQLTSVKGKKIPANTGIILEGAKGDAISLPLTTEATEDVTDNDLLVSDGTVEGNGSTIYVLANGSKGVGFYKLQNDDDDKVPAGKAYLKIEGPASAPAFFGFGFGGGTTGIDNLTPALSNGEEVYYDLQGRRVAQPTKGLYIVNGKKVIIN